MLKTKVKEIIETGTTEEQKRVAKLFLGLDEWDVDDK